MKKSTFTILFFIKKNDPKRNGLVTIMIRLTIDGKQIQFSSKLEVDPNKWDQKSSKVKGRSPQTKEINYLLNQIRLEINKHYFNLHQIGTDCVLKRIRNAFLGRIDQTSLTHLFSEHIKNLEEKVGVNISRTTVYKYKVTIERIQDFLKTKYHNPDILVNDVTPKFIDGFYVYLRKKKKCENNTAMKYLQRLSTIIKYAEHEGLIIKNPFRYYPITFDQTIPVFLTREEIEQIAEKAFISNRLSLVRDVFVFSCWTGLSFSDLCKLSNSHIKTGHDGEKWIIIHRTKTNTPAHIPLLPISSAILHKYQKSRSNGAIFDVKSNQKTNEYLREIADLCGIDRHLNFHVARHSFATMMLNYGVSLESLARMMGHKTIKTTQLYGQITDRKIIAEIKSIQHRFDVIREIRK